MILVDVVPSSRYSIKSIIFERLRSFLRQKERATWNETKRKNFRNNIQHPFKYFTDPPPPPLPPRSPTIHIYYFLSLFFFSFLCRSSHLAIIHIPCSLSFALVHRSLRRILLSALFGNTNVVRSCLFIALQTSGQRRSLGPANLSFFFASSEMELPSLLILFSGPLLSYPPFTSFVSPLFFLLLPPLLLALRLARSLARVSRRYPAHSISVCIIQDIYTGTVRDGLTGAPPEVRQTSPEWPWIVATSMDTPSTDSQCLFRTVATPRLHKAFTTFLTFGEPGREIIIVAPPNSSSYIHIYIYT